MRLIIARFGVRATEGGPYRCNSLASTRRSGLGHDSLDLISEQDAVGVIRDGAADNGVMTGVSWESIELLLAGHKRTLG